MIDGLSRWMMRNYKNLAQDGNALGDLRTSFKMSSGIGNWDGLPKLDELRGSSPVLRGVADQIPLAYFRKSPKEGRLQV